MMIMERLNDQNKREFHDYCWLYASHLDQSFFPLNEAFPVAKSRPGFLFYDEGILTGVVCLLLDDSFTKNAKGRLMILHSRKKADQIYQMLLEKVLPFAVEKNVKDIFAFLPDHEQQEKAVFLKLGFHESRKTLYLRRDKNTCGEHRLTKPIFKLRDFKPSKDMGLWCDLINSVYKDVPGHIPYTPHMVKEDIETDGTFPGCARIAYLEGQAIGFYYCSLEAQDELWISQLGVMNEYRSKGIGRALLHECLQLADEFNAHCAFSVNAENEAGIALFKSESFEVKKTYTAMVYPFK
ncbi:MAG TPA: GNAT family N-acetyltransferase [Thermotogota bacterium]|nr:GNAT family N-acetyltransferase [Thermotogota bacterium]HRW34328.1 GNAT family N-acetyltransferase [Thermotogota bacterium]